MSTEHKAGTFCSILCYKTLKIMLLAAAKLEKMGRTQKAFNNALLPFLFCHFFFFSNLLGIICVS